MFGANFLVPNGTFIVELLIFLIVLGVIAKFVLPPIQKVMEDRSNTVRSAVQASNEGQVEADRLERERFQVLDEARSEARRLLDESGHQVAAMIEDARARAQAEHDRQIESAQQTLNAERSQLREAAIGRLSGLVVSAASQIVGTAIDESKHSELIEGTVAEARTESGV